MSDENATSPGAAEEVAQDTAREAVEAQSANDQAEQVETETDENGDAVSTEEFELDVAGTKYKFAKGTPIEEALEHVQKYAKGIEADYTRKSQDVAARRKALEQHEELARRITSLGIDRAKDLARGQEVSAFIAEFESPQGQAYLAQLWQSNADQARQLSARYAASKAEHDQIEGRLRQHGNAENEARTRLREAAAKEGEAVVAKAIKGWSPEAEKELKAFVVSEGVPVEDAENWRLMPRVAVWAHEAMQHRKMLAQAAKKTAAAPTPPPAQPITPMKAKPAPTAKDPERMSTAEWMRWRQAQIRKRG